MLKTLVAVPVVMACSLGGTVVLIKLIQTLFPPSTQTRPSAEEPNEKKEIP